MSFTYDLSTSAGKVRLLIPDRVEDEQIFDDDEIDAFLLLESDSLKRAAALALETIASDEALVQKVIKTLNLQTDGAKTADALLKRAKTLRDQASKEEQKAAEEEDDGDGLFDFAEIVVDSFSARDRLWNEGLRHG